jgi:hypothetical protein
MKKKLIMKFKYILTCKYVYVKTCTNLSSCVYINKLMLKVKCSVYKCESLSLSSCYARIAECEYRAIRALNKPNRE